jgi:hypothetical protein
MKAIHAEDAFADPDLTGRRTGPFAVGLTLEALTAWVFTFSDTPETKPPQNAKKGPKGANETAVKPGNDEIQ